MWIPPAAAGGIAGVSGALSVATITNCSSLMLYTSLTFPL